MPDLKYGIDLTPGFNLLSQGLVQKEQLKLAAQENATKEAQAPLIRLKNTAEAYKAAIDLEDPQMAQDLIFKATGVRPDISRLDKSEVEISIPMGEKGETLNFSGNKTALKSLAEGMSENPEFFTDKDNVWEAINFIANQPGVKKFKVEPPKTTPSNLKKLMGERDELIKSGLPEDDPKIRAYDARISGADIDVENLTQEEIDTLGMVTLLTGKMPSLGRGKQATKVRMQIAKSMARQALNADEDGIPDIPNKTPSEAAFDIVGKQSDTKAIQGSLNFLDKQVSAMGSFVDNLSSQITKVGELSKDLETFDTRLLNIPLRLVRGRIAGSPLQSKYDLYLAEIESEIGKLATGSAASIAELSTTAQERWDKIHDKNLSVKDMLSLLDETRNAAFYRLNSVERQLGKTRKRMKTREYKETKQPANSGEDPPTKSDLSGLSDKEILEMLDGE